MRVEANLDLITEQHESPQEGGCAENPGSAAGFFNKRKPGVTA